MTYPITPDPSIHQIPSGVTNPQPLFTGTQLQTWVKNLPLAMTKALVDAILTSLGASAADIALTNEGIDAMSAQIQAWLTPTAANAQSAYQNWDTLFTALGLPEQTATDLAAWLSGVNTTANNAWANWTTLLEDLGLPEQTATALVSWLQNLQSDSSGMVTAWTTFLQSAMTAFTNDAGNWPQLLSDLEAAWSTLWTTITTLEADEVTTLQQIIGSLLGFNTSTGLLPPAQVQSSTGAADLTADWDAVLQPFQSVANLTSTTAWQNSWSGIEALLGVPVAGVNDVQTISPTTSGTQTITFNGHAATSSIANGATAATVLAALDTIAALNGNISVAGTGPWTVTFSNALAGAAQPLMTTNGTGATVTHTTVGGGGLSSSNTPTQIAPAQVSNVLGNGNLGADLTSMATSLFGADAVNNITILEQDIINFIGNAISGGNAATSANSPAAPVLSALQNIPHANVVIPPSPGSGSITHDASASATPFNGAVALETLTWNHTCGANANYLTVRVGIVLSNATSVSVNASYGGNVMQLLASESSGAEIVTQIYGLANPAIGSAQQVSVTIWTPYGNYVEVVEAESDSYIGVGSVGSTAVNSGIGSSPSLTVPSAANDYIVQSFIAFGGGALSSYNQTSRYNSGAVGLSVLLAGDAPGATSVSFTATAATPSACTFSAAAVNLIPLPSEQIGSGFRAANTSTSTVSASSGNNLFVNGFFNSVISQTSDLSYSPSTFNTVTVLHAGWYNVTIAVLMVSTFNNQFLGLNLVQTPSGGSATTKRGHTTLVSNPSFNTNLVLAFTFQVYCSAGDTLQPGYYSSVSGSAFTGTTDGLSSYFEVSVSNRSLM